MSSLRDDEISKRIFYAGIFCLPWLQLVHAIGFYSKQRAEVIRSEPGAFIQLLPLRLSVNWDLVLASG